MLPAGRGADADAGPAVVYSSRPLQAADAGLVWQDQLDPPPAPIAIAFEGRYADSDLNAIAPYVNAEFYLLTYPDVAADGADPVAHFGYTGWREGRNPNPWFNTEHYLGAYPDVVEAAVNPLWHYLVSGQHENRECRPSQACSACIARLAAVAAAHARQDDAGVYVAPPEADVLDATALSARFAHAAEVGGGFVVSISHDCYLHNIGGTQFFVADEQCRFNADRFVYCHLSPATARLTLAPEGEAPLLQVVLDGRFIGIASGAAIAAALRLSAPLRALQRLLVVHCPLGHDPDVLAELAAALQPGHSVWWVHDFTSVCESFHLLRNDAAYCGAPSPHSPGCGICVYGPRRPRHLARLRRLFDRVSFDVVAPSRVALDIWLQASDLPYRSVRVHRHGRLVPDEAPAGTDAPVRALSDASDPARIAFVGHPNFAKGYGFFAEPVRRCANIPAYRFHHHLSSSEGTVPAGVTRVPVTASRRQPRAMIEALSAHRIDLVLMLSPWPETFSYVTMEALAAGADVVALAEGGNVAALARELARGVVLRDEHALYDFFVSGQAAAHVRAMRVAQPVRSRFELTGTTATLALTAEAAEDPAVTGDPDLRLFVGGKFLRPVRTASGYRFRLPAGAAVARLVSRTAVPIWQVADSTDERRLGVAVCRLVLDGTGIALDDDRLRDGWYGVESDFRWTDGDAAVDVSGVRVLSVMLIPMLTFRRSAFAQEAATPCRDRRKAGEATRRVPARHTLPAAISDAAKDHLSAGDA